MIAMIFGGDCVREVGFGTCNRLSKVHVKSTYGLGGTEWEKSTTQSRTEQTIMNSGTGRMNDTGHERVHERITRTCIFDW